MIWKNAYSTYFSSNLSKQTFKTAFLMLFVCPCLLFGSVRTVSSRCEQTCHWLMRMILFGALRD